MCYAYYRRICRPSSQRPILMNSAIDTPDTATNQAQPRRFKQWAVNGALMAASILLVLLVLEAGLRFRYAIAPSHLAWDDTLGWRTQENYAFDGQVLDAEGEAYHVAFTTDESGFRRFGDLATDLPKLLVIGDSFTLARHASDGETFYDHLANALPVEVFAYGSEGYGTTQEWMAMQEIVLQKVDPDIVLWQFTSNDFINNSYELETRSRWNNNGWTRPYQLANGETVYKSPHPLGAWNSFLIRHSRLGHSLSARLSPLLFPPPEPGVEAEILEQGRDHPLLPPAVGITESVLREVRAVFRDIPFLLFDVGPPFAPLNEAAKDAAGAAEIQYIQGVIESVEEAQRRGETVTCHDRAHWNPRGHAIAAEVLISYFRRHVL